MTKGNLIGNWNWANAHVQPRAQIDESRFINGATVLICAGPPRLSGPDEGSARNEQAAEMSGSDNIVFPIGVCLDASINQQRALQRLYEVGSDRSYFVQGRSSGQIGLNRVLFNGANLLRVLYAYYPQSQIAGLGTEPTGKDETYADEQALDSVAATVNGDITKYTGLAGPTLPEVKMNPGHNNHYMNLASDLFNHPLGLLFKFQDVTKRTMATFYCEMCYVATHGMTIQANAGSLVAEQIQMQFDRIAPIKVTE